jgi:hypothetical protein
MRATQKYGPKTHEVIKQNYYHSGELFRILRASQEAQDELAAHPDVGHVLDYFGVVWTGPSKHRF